MTQPKPLSATLPGTWQLLSRIDVTAAGERRPEPALGEDPLAVLIYDRSGHFAAQFMRRDCPGVTTADADAARIRLDEAVQRLEQGGLAGTGGSHQGYELTAPDRERIDFQRQRAAVALREPLHLDRRLDHGAS